MAKHILNDWPRMYKIVQDMKLSRGKSVGPTCDVCNTTEEVYSNYKPMAGVAHMITGYSNLCRSCAFALGLTVMIGDDL